MKCVSCSENFCCVSRSFCEKNCSFCEVYLWLWYIWLFGLKLKIRLKNETKKPIFNTQKKPKTFFRFVETERKNTLFDLNEISALFTVEAFCKLIKYWFGSHFNAPRFRLESHAMKFIFSQVIFYVTLNSRNLLVAIENEKRKLRNSIFQKILSLCQFCDTSHSRLPVDGCQNNERRAEN